jgi:DeoR/GlpR family transcriptional regulator of sugar metabolism
MPKRKSDMIEQEQRRTNDEKEEIASEAEGCVSKEILIKNSSRCFEIWKLLNNKIWI